jgi:deoxyribonuclease-4
MSLKLGSHLSTAGGVHTALLRAEALGFCCVALFTRNQRQWRPPPLAEDALRRFRALRERRGLSPIAAHGSYLMNLAGRDEVRDRSRGALADELDRCRRLGIEYLVLHPGSNPRAEEGIARIADALDEARAEREDDPVTILLENTAGAGNTLGGNPAELGAIRRRLARPQRVGVCLDTCHAFAAGWDLASAGGRREWLAAIDGELGEDAVRLVHANDSLFACGSRRDRHAHIGRGEIGRRGFAGLLEEPRLRGLPWILETPKEDDPLGRPMDLINARTLLGLAGEDVSDVGNRLRRIRRRVRSGG